MGGAEKDAKTLDSAGAEGVYYPRSNILWGGVKVSTGSKVCEERKLPIGCDSRTDGHSPDEKRKKRGIFCAPLRGAFFCKVHVRRNKEYPK